MKYLKTLLLSITVLGLLSLYACSSDDGDVGPNPEEELEMARQEIIESLTVVAWEPSSVVREGVDASSAYEGFQLEVKQGSYKTVNGGQAWPESGTWQFVEGQSDQIVRDDGVLITVEIKGDNVELSFTFTEEIFSGGRTKTVQTFIVFLLEQLAGAFGNS